jgi:NHL repeat
MPMSRLVLCSLWLCAGAQLVPASATSAGLSYAGAFDLTPPPGVVTAPTGAAVDADGFVTVIAGAYVQRFDPAGTLVRRWGGFGTGPGQFLPGGGYTRGPQSIAADAAGRLYVADAGGNRVLVYSAAGDVLGVWGRNGGDGTAGTAPGELNAPVSLAVEPGGSVLVLDGSYTLQRFSATGASLQRSGRVEGRQVAVADDGSIYLRVWGDRLERLDAATLAPAGAIALPSRPPPVSTHQTMPASCCGLAALGGSIWAGSSHVSELRRYALDGTATYSCSVLPATPEPLVLGGDELVAGRDGMLYLLQRSVGRAGRIVRLRVDDESAPECGRLPRVPEPPRTPLVRPEIVSLRLTLGGETVKGARVRDFDRLRLRYTLSAPGQKSTVRVWRLGRERQPLLKTLTAPAKLRNRVRMWDAERYARVRPGRYELRLQAFGDRRSKPATLRFRLRR